MNKLIGFNVNLFKLLTVFFLVVTISFLNISGCGSSGNNSKIIGPEGGNVRTSDGRFNLFIPSGALTEDTEISIVRVDSGLDGVIAYDAEPDGLIFLVPARLSGDVTDLSDNNDSNINVMVGFNDANTGTNQLGDQIYFVDLADGTATYSAEVNHFSRISLISKFLDIMRSTVPEQAPANSKLVDFNISVSNSSDGLPQAADFNISIDSATYVDLSNPMVLYNGQPTPIVINNPVMDSFGTEQRYDCGNPGPGLFRVDFFVAGETNIDDNNVNFGILLNEPFNILVQTVQDVNCLGSDGSPPPPPPPPGDDDDDDMGDDDDDDSMQEVSISADTTKVNIDHTIGVTECPTFGTPIKVTATGTPPEVRIVVVENLDFLDVTPGNILTDMGMATLTPIFPCSGFEEGMNIGSITIEARDPDTNELLDSIMVDVMVTVTPSS